MTQPPPPVPDHMQAVQVVEHNAPYQLRTVPVPTIDAEDLGPHDLLVKVAAASYCHTDGMVAAGVFGDRLPVTASHEGSGTVVRVGGGGDASSSGFRVGDRVMCGLPFHPCGSCGDCRGGQDGEGIDDEGRQQYCASTEGHVGVHIDGCFAEYVRVGARFTTKLPQGVSLLRAAPLACAGRTVWRAVLQTGLKRGQWIAIVGSGGGLGHLGIQFAKKALGLRVIGIDARDEALTLSDSMGADATNGPGADATVVLSDAPGAAALGCAVTRMHGTVVQVAQPDEVSVPFQELVFRDIRLKGSLLCSPAESRAMLEAVAAHGVEVRTNLFRGLDSIGELMERVKGGRVQGKAVIVVDQRQIDVEEVRSNHAFSWWTLAAGFQSM
ncbi:Alcohol dehydrogenase 4 [Apiospora phragmitis]|uniref:Alcohol dehydrogenase 4 n=1 Tax=Apiospora phragmitis TaxID=2905665 RepID=A0ABR1USW0_9PEZI